MLCEAERQQAEYATHTARHALGELAELRQWKVRLRRSVLCAILQRTQLCCS